MERAFELDKRYGRDMGLTGRFADMQGFEIVNFVGGMMACHSGRLSEVMFGPHSKFVASDPAWADLMKASAAFSHRNQALRGRGEAAAQLADEIDEFEAVRLKPYAASLTTRMVA